MADMSHFYWMHHLFGLLNIVEDEGLLCLASDTTINRNVLSGQIEWIATSTIYSPNLKNDDHSFVL